MAALMADIHRPLNLSTCTRSIVYDRGDFGSDYANQMCLKHFLLKK